MKKKSVKKKLRLIDLHMYGIFDAKKESVIKVSLDKTEIDMDYALLGKEEFMQCEFYVKLLI